MDVTEILLPGVGVRYEFPTSAGDRVGIVAKRDREFDLVRYGGSDPDAPETLLTLTREEADAVAEILGAPRIVERFADLTREVPGLVSGALEVAASSRFDGQPLGATRSRTLTGASIVAVVRGDRVLASPAPTEVLRGGDLLVVVGTPSGIDGVRRILQS
jgi:TrkA domain protein